MATEFEEFIRKYKAKIKDGYEFSGIAVVSAEYTVEEEWIQMSDGVRLKACIYKPRLEGKLPTILQRTCYPNNEEMNKMHGIELAKRGYAYIYEFCRGTGVSEGEWVPNVNERQDGLDTLNWLDGQEWVDCIGYWGESYLALTGWAVADILPKKVVSMCLGYYGTDRCTSAYEKGMFRHDVLTSWAIQNAGFKIDADYMASCKHRPHIKVDEDLWGGKIDWYRDWITNTYPEDTYWQEGFWKLLKDIPAKANVPIYITEGWYDHHLGSALNTYESLPEEVKENSWLDIGPWNHYSMSVLAGHDSKHSVRSKGMPYLEWFELTLKKKQLPTKKISTYMIGEDCWKEFSSWPIKSTQYREIYLDSNENKNMLNFVMCPTEEKRINFVYDPENPVPSHGAEAMLQTMNEVGSLKQDQPDYRSDVISFISDILPEDLAIQGKIKVRLFVSTDGEDTAFTAKVMEVMPNGDAYNIRSSITTIGHELGENKSYIPGSVVEVSVDMWDIAWTVKMGSKLRVDISSSDFPQYSIHSNYAGGWALQEKVRKANQTVYCSVEYPSRIILPII